MSRAQWREPSQRSGLHQIENRTWFACEARTSDGALFWRGWFEDRDEADEFLYRLIRHQLCGDDFPVEAMRSPVGPSYPHTFVTSSWYRARYEGEWRKEWRDLPLSYELVTVVFLTGTSSSNQTYNKPGDWTDSGSVIELVGGGGSGSAQSSTTASAYAIGGGAGAYVKITGFSFTGSTATYRLPGGVSGVVATLGLRVDGNSGKDVWWNDTAFPTTGTNKAGAKGGSFGDANSSAVGPGGTAAASYASGGTTAKQSGGSASDGTVYFSSGGAGGAGGPNGAGADGAVETADNQAVAGGAGDNGSGGAGSAGNTLGNSSNGGAGAELGNLTKGCGGGSGGCLRNNVAAVSGNAGLYGAGSGGAALWNGTSESATSGDGAQPLIVITYTAAASTLKFRRSLSALGTRTGSRQSHF